MWIIVSPLLFRVGLEPKMLFDRWSIYPRRRDQVHCYSTFLFAETELAAVSELGRFAQ